MAGSAGAGEHDLALDQAIALSLALADQQQGAGGAAGPAAQVPLPASGQAPPGASSAALNLSDPDLELTDPAPDLHALFREFDRLFFGCALRAVECRWSPRMTRCAGLCSYNPKERYCSIRISEPLHRLRPRRDLVETLVHEMIHAYLFVAARNSDHDDHGPCFQSHMRRINAQANLNIDIYHSFHDEVRHYQQHWWKCDGPCSKRPPFYGIVRRAMNRAPGPSDRWWAEHQRSCGGTYHKIKSPPPKAGASARKRPRPGGDIRDALKRAAAGKGSGAAAGAQPTSQPREGGAGPSSKRAGAAAATVAAAQSGCPSGEAAAAAAVAGPPRAEGVKLGGSTRSTPGEAALRRMATAATTATAGSPPCPEASASARTPATDAADGAVIDLT